MVILDVIFCRDLSRMNFFCEQNGSLNSLFFRENRACSAVHFCLSDVILICPYFSVFAEYNKRNQSSRYIFRAVLYKLRKHEADFDPPSQRSANLRFPQRSQQIRARILRTHVWTSSGCLQTSQSWGKWHFFPEYAPLSCLSPALSYSLIVVNYRVDV